MHEKKAMIVVIMVIVMVYHLLGEIKARGKLSIASASGEKYYDVVITIKQAEIMIECEKKIFQPFNEFDAPKQAKIKVSTAEVYEIVFNKKKNEIYIIAEDSLYQRFKHLLLPVYRIIRWFPYHEEKDEAFIIIINNPKDIGCIEEDLIKHINERKQKSCVNR